MKYKHRFMSFSVINRWRIYPRLFNGSWTILGIQQWYASWEDYFIAFCFFGLEFRFWMQRSRKEDI